MHQLHLRCLVGIVQLRSRRYPSERSRHTQIHTLVKVQTMRRWRLGEDIISNHDETLRGEADTSTAFHTALAILAILSTREADSLTVEAGIDHLLKTLQPDRFWHDEGFNAPGFPKFFYLKYHGYEQFSPLWAFGRYRNERFGRVHRLYSVKSDSAI